MTAPNLGLSSTASSTLSGPVTIGRDIRLTGSANTLTINGPKLEVTRDVRLEGGAGTSVANLASPLTTVGGLLSLDADTTTRTSP